MAKSRAKKSRKTIYIVVLLIFLGAIGYGYYKSQVQPSNIFVIEESPVQYGDTTVTGTLRKDTSVGELGHYILVLPDGRPILLDAHGLDMMLGAIVTVRGRLFPSLTSSAMMTMTVNNLTITKE